VSPVIEAVRTPEERFDGLPGFEFEPRYRDWDGLRLAHLDEGEGQPLLMLHGQPSWSFLFRKMIPPLVEAGYRCVAPDYPGFGRSDKPVDESWYSYDRHTDVIRDLIEELDLRDIVLVGHDWGGPIGLRLAIDHPERFSRFVLIDTPFFTGRQVMPPMWWAMHEMIAATPELEMGDLVRRACSPDPGDAVVAAYDAPFPDTASKAGARAFPMHVLPRSPEEPAAQACWRVMKAMRKDDRPTLTFWGESDPLFPVELGQWVTGAMRRELPRVVPGGHFLPEDRGEELAASIAEWLEEPLPTSGEVAHDDTKGDG
jgi:haloalkane dehalogenase